MEQKQTLWILAAAGVFLCVVIGAALILYRPMTKAPDIANVSNQSSQVYTNPSSATIADPASQGMSATAPDGTLQGAAADGTIDLGNLAFDNTQNSLNSTSTPAPVVGNANEIAVTKPATTVVNNTPAPAASEVVISTPKAPAGSTSTTATGASTSGTPKASTNTSTSTKTETVTEYWVQAGSFSGRSYAENAQDIISSYKIESEIFTKEVNGKTMYRVRIGPYRTHTEADYWMTVIQSDPLFKDAYITEVKTKK